MKTRQMKRKWQIIRDNEQERMKEWIGRREENRKTWKNKAKIKNFKRMKAIRKKN